MCVFLLKVNLRPPVTRFQWINSVKMIGNVKAATRRATSASVRPLLRELRDFRADYVPSPGFPAKESKTEPSTPGGIHFENEIIHFGSFVDGISATFKNARTAWEPENGITFHVTDHKLPSALNKPGEGGTERKRHELRNHR